MGVRIMTITPYTPEFNPIEIFFRSIKARFSDTVRRKTIEDVFSHLYKSIRRDLPLSKFPRFY